MKMKSMDWIVRRLLFSLQESLDTGIKMIDKVDVMSIAEWNNDDIYGKYPFVKLK